MLSDWKKGLPFSSLALCFNQSGHSALNYLPQNARGAGLKQRLVLIENQWRVWVGFSVAATCEHSVPWHHHMQQVRMDSWTFSPGHTEGARQASEGCASSLTEGRGFSKNIWPPRTTAPRSLPEGKSGLCFLSHPYTSFPRKWTYCTLQRRTICWISFHSFNLLNE